MQERSGKTWFPTTTSTAAIRAFEASYTNCAEQRSRRPRQSSSPYREKKPRSITGLVGCCAIRKVASIDARKTAIFSPVLVRDPSDFHCRGHSEQEVDFLLETKCELSRV